MRLLLLLPSLALAAGRHAPEGVAWPAHYPQAARGLADWKTKYPAAAHQLADFDAKEPTHSRDFLVWTIGHAGDNFDLFVLGHRDWTRLTGLLEHEHPAMDAFARWLQGDPAASRALTSRLRTLSQGLEAS